MTKGDGRTSPKHFQPTILEVFGSVGGEFDAIYERLKS
jgi:hypothetical protein